MRFEEEVVMRRLPFTNINLIKLVFKQLASGTILEVEPLGEFQDMAGILFHTRRSYGGSSAHGLTYYKVTNDERRVLLRKIKEHYVSYREW